MGGLVAANYLARAGRRVLLVEQHPVVGGCTTNFKRKGFRFDSSTHVINGCEPGGLIHNVLRAIDATKCCEFIKVPSLMRWIDDAKSIDVSLPTALPNYVETLAELFPHEQAGIRRFFADHGEMFRDMAALSFGSGPARLAAAVRAIPTLYRLLRMRGKTAARLLAPYVQDPDCLDVMTVLSGFAGLTPEQLDAAMFVFADTAYRTPGEGAHYPRGGSGAFSRALAGLFKQRAGTLWLNSRVKKIRVADGAAAGVVVEGKGGRVRQAGARAVIAASDLTELVAELCPRGLSPAAVGRVRARRPGMSAVVLFAGLDLDLRARGIHDYEIHRANGVRMDRDLVRRVVEKADFSVLPGDSVTVYSNVDPSCCAAGKSVVSTLFFAEPGPFEAVLEPDGSRGEAYRALKARVAEQLLASCGRALGIVDIEKHVEVLELATPVTIKRYTSNRNGSFIGWRLTPDQGPFSAPRATTRLPNLFLCGQWVFPGGGVSGVMKGGLDAARMTERHLAASGPVRRVGLTLERLLGQALGLA